MPASDVNRYCPLPVTGCATTLAANWFGYLSIVVLVGLLGGLGMGAVAGTADPVGLSDLPGSFARLGPGRQHLPRSRE